MKVSNDSVKYQFLKMIYHTTRAGSTEVRNLYDIATQNCIRILDELAKTQHIQSISNLQHDYVVAAKNTIENMVSVQKMLANNVKFSYGWGDRTRDRNFSFRFLGACPAGLYDFIWNFGLCAIRIIFGQ